MIRYTSNRRAPRGSYRDAVAVATTETLQPEEKQPGSQQSMSEIFDDLFGEFMGGHRRADHRYNLEISFLEAHKAVLKRGFNSETVRRFMLLFQQAFQTVNNFDLGTKVASVAVKLGMAMPLSLSGNCPLLNSRELEWLQHLKKWVGTTVPLR